VSYEEKQLFQLQQILFFKELGFSLKQIQKVLGKNDFDQLAALYSHKKALSHEWEKIELLLKTIDKTINHIKGKNKMKDEEIFDGFCITLVKKANPGTSYALAEEIVCKSVKNPTKDIEDVKAKGKAYYDKINQEACQLFQELTACIETNQPPSAFKVQKIIKKHHLLIENFHNATQKVYKAMAQLYAEHPELIKQLDPFHPKLALFMSEAMKIFADQKLS